ncbi:MAG: AsmA family protein [Bacteroidales bacterium]|nr:AsmA family protein [Bacteroidales bacterium]
MKKGWKIALISLGSLLGLVVITVVVVLWLVFTPSQLTKIVNSLSGKFLTCETYFERVDLTLLSTFPDAGLKVENVYLVNPVEGAPSDTLARIGSVTVGLDLKAFLKENRVEVHQVIVDDALANVYIAPDGKGNFDIVKPSDKNDTSESDTKLPEQIDLKKIKIKHLNAHFKDEKDGLEVKLSDFDLALKGTMKDEMVDALLNVDSREIAFVMTDSTGKQSMTAMLKNPSIRLKGKGNMDDMEGKLNLTVESGRFNSGGTEMINEQLQASKRDLLVACIEFGYRNSKIEIRNGDLKVDDYALTVDGKMKMKPMEVDVKLQTDDAWQVAPLLAFVPDKFMSWKKGMDVDGKVKLEATAVGTLTDSTMPLIDAHVLMADGRFYYPKALPYKVNKINGDVTARLDLGRNGRSRASIKKLSAATRDTRLSVSGEVDDLLGDMLVDARIKGTLPLADLKPMIPDTMPVAMEGNADVELQAKLKVSQLKQRAFDKIVADGMLKLNQLDVIYDSIHAAAPSLDIALRIPAVEHKGQMADAHITGSHLAVDMPGKNATLENPNIKVGVNNMLQQQLAADFDVKAGETEANLDSTMASFGALAIKGSMRMDSTQQNVLKKFNPTVDIDMHSAVFYTPMLPDAVRMSQFAFEYNPKNCEIKTAEVKIGHSDFQLYGTVDNLEDWLDHRAMLTGDLNFTSSYTDVDQLMAMFSGMGSDADSLEQMRKEDKVPDEANPFIVPKDVDITLHTHIRRSIAFGNDLNDVAGALTVKDGVAILDQIGFVCKAATMQLTAYYKSPRPNNLFAAIDFHLLDIQIDELLAMIPCVDTLVPMLKAFNGNANFHLAGESFLDARYQPKMSTLLGSAAISGKDLVVMDNSSIAQVAKLMQFKSWKDKDDKIKIDSLSVEMTCLRKEIEVFPFVLNVGKYQLCASGKHTLDNVCNYHIELLKNPLLAKVGVDIKGPLSKPKISLGEVRYADLYKPSKQGVVEKRTLELKNMIRKALEANVR